MGYEIYNRTNKRVGKPSLTISLLARMSLNKEATQALEKLGVERILLLWDKSARKVGIKPSLRSDDSRSYKLSFGRKGNGAGFSAKTFFDYIHYDYTTSRRYPLNWNEDQGIFETEIAAEHLTDGQLELPVTTDTANKDESLTLVGDGTG